MKIITRAIEERDREGCIYVEKGAMPHNRYINDVWDMFLYKTDGNLIGAFCDDKLCGMGKLTRLYKNFGWLETLRVHPDYQNKGVGKEIYKAYLKHMKELNLISVGMYTEMYNDISKYLAEKNGLSVREEFTEILKPVIEVNEEYNNFRLVKKEEGEELLSPYYNKMGNYIVINRTFFPVGEGLGEYLASENWVYIDENKNILIGGYRFQPEKAFHIPFMVGDIELLLKFANYLGNKSNSKNLSILKEKNSKDIDIFLEKGFVKDDNYMTLWIDL